MPLLSPSQIHQALRPLVKEQKEKRNLQELLNDACLTPEEVLDNLSAMMRAGDSDSTRLRAAETALKLNGLLNNDVVQMPSVTIIIKDSEFSLNPILVPR